MSNLPIQSNNLNEVQINLGQDCYDIQHKLEFEQSDNKAGTRAVKLKIGLALSGPLPTMQAEALATTGTSITEDKQTNLLKSGTLWRKDDVKLLNNFYSAMGKSKTQNHAYGKMIRYESVIRKPLTMTSKLVMSTKSNNLR